MLTIRKLNGERCSIQVPDCWHAALLLEEPMRSVVLDTWHLAHDMSRELRRIYNGSETTMRDE